MSISFLTLLIAVIAASGAEAAAKYAQDISNKLNPTGRTVTIPVPLSDQGTTLGDVVIEIKPDDTILVGKAEILDRLAPVISEETRGAIALLPDAGGFVPIDAFAGAGVPIAFDHGLQQLAIAIDPGKRASADLSMAARTPAAAAAASLVPPERLAGYVNVLAGVDHVWERTGYSDETSARLGLDGALRFGNVVFETRASYDGDVDINECPPHVICTYSHAAGLKRQISRFVYDVPDYQTRVTVGDADGIALPIQRAADVLGVSVEKTARKLAPGENLMSTGGGSFTLDRSATVTVLVNGRALQTLRLRPGHYGIHDLPLASGGNDVKLEITKDDGTTETLSFTNYGDASLLAAGKSEWVVSGGVPSYLLDNARTYRDNAVLASGYMRYGLSDAVTAEAHLQGDNDVLMGGLAFVVGTDLGVFNIGGAVSDSSSGTGAAASFAWNLANFSGLLGEKTESFFVGAEYRSTDFHTPGEYLSTATGILYPEFNYWLQLNATYSAPVYGDIIGSISGRYMFANPDRKLISENTVTNDQYGADIALSSPLTETTTASLVAGYSNELYVYDAAKTRNVDPEFRVALRFDVRPDERSSVSAGYDTLGSRADVSANRNAGSGVGRWDTNISVNTLGNEDTANLAASASYYGNRGEVQLSHSANADSTGFSDLTDIHNRTSLTASTAIAFAGDKVAIGPPIKNGAFAILTPHDTLAGHEIIAGNPDDVRARADDWGNGLVSDIPAYMPSAVPVDVADLPLGYSLGSGAFQTFAPYKAGYVFEVGSNYSVSLYGTMITAKGDALAFIAGTARSASGSGKSVAIFTNAEGRFGAEGLAPGHWIIEMGAEEGPLYYAVDVPDTANGLVKVGTLAPIERPSQ